MAFRFNFGSPLEEMLRRPRPRPGPPSPYFGDPAELDREDPISRIQLDELSSPKPEEMSPLTRRISLPPPRGGMESPGYNNAPGSSVNSKIMGLMEPPARNEEELRGHQRQRNDIAAAQLPLGDLSLEEEEKPKEEEALDRLDFSRINELSQSYEDHLGNLPEREDQGLKRKLLSILLGYGASLGGRSRAWTSSW